METVFTGHLALKFNDRWTDMTTVEREQAVKEVVTLFDRNKSRITLRAVYVTQAFRADTDLFLWMYGTQPEDVQDIQLALRRTALGRASTTSWSFVGMSHSAEFNPDHIPSFLRGVPAKTYLCFYPYIRSAEWYLLPSEDRARMLKEHGDIGREYPGILTNGVYNFGIGDFEWLLSFESDDLTKIVNMMRRMRETQARRHTKHEWPFIVGRCYALEEALAKYV